MQKMNSTIFNNVIEKSDISPYSDKLQKHACDYVSIISTFLNHSMNSKNKEKYSSYISDYKLKKIGEESKLGKNKKPMKVPVYFVDKYDKPKEILKETAKAEDIPDNAEIKKNKDGKEVYSFTVVTKRGKFLTVKKNIKNFMTTLFIYFKNDCLEIANVNKDNLCLDNFINGVFTGFVIKAAIPDKVYKKWFTDYKFEDEECSAKIKEKFTDLESNFSQDITRQLKNVIPMNITTQLTDYFVRFICNIAYKACLIKIDMDSAISDQVLKYVLKTLCLEYADFEYTELFEYLSKDLLTAEQKYAKPKETTDNANTNAPVTNNEPVTNNAPDNTPTVANNEPDNEPDNVPEDDEVVDFV